MMEILKKIDFLRFFHESTLERLAQESKLTPLEEGIVIFQEGDLGKTMYIVLQGEILIHQNDKSLTTMQPGDFFGEMSLIESLPRTASARTLVPSLLMEINENQFQEYFTVQPKALLAIMKTLSARSRKISSKLVTNDTYLNSGNENINDFTSLGNKEFNREVFVFKTENFQFVKVNSFACQELGYDPEEFKKMTLLDLSINLTKEILRQSLDSLAKGTRPIVGFEAILRRKDGSNFPADCKIQKIHNESGNSEAMIWVEDITERKQMEETIRQMAYFDSLTGLPNRNLLNDRLAVALAHAIRNNEQVAIMFLDLDNFKTINDTLGHEAGDQLLQLVAHRLRDLLRKEDTIARMGGDEFIILIPHLKKTDDAAKLAQKVLETLEPPIRIEGHDLYIRCSIGIAIFPTDGTEIKTLLKNSDLAMYRAKEKGKNTFELYTSSMNNRAMERLSIERNLRKGLENDEFNLFYQPKINLTTGQVAGLEALLRWENPELGFVMPDQYITIAEETRLIIEIGYWMIEKACRQSRVCKEKGWPLIPIAINLSALQFNHPLLIQKIEEMLSSEKLLPEYIEIEITESILMRDTKLAISNLNKLKELGIKIAIDDFGTGYSSLNYLKNLPIDFLKIDKTFIQEYSLPKNAAITRAIVALAQSLKLKTIAEGVESEEQKNFLINLECDEAQGFLFCKPLAEKEIMEYLEEALSKKIKKLIYE